jgi:hypothetical protein
MGKVSFGSCHLSLFKLHYAQNEEERKRVIDVLCCESCV